MTNTVGNTIKHVNELNPQISSTDLIQTLKPPAHFQHASFNNYVPDAQYPSQQETLEYLQTFLSPKRGEKVRLFRKRKPETAAAPVTPGIYLDGGFGVGKTHLLAALWNSATGRKYYGTFIEYTALVGAIGYAQTVQLLTGSSLICIDEFELDDPGDTMMMTRLLTHLADHGTKIAATSNTPPNALGEGRFAAADFLREIQSLSSRFTVKRIEGQDYRRRGTSEQAKVLSQDQFDSLLEEKMHQEGVFFATAEELLQHLATVHPAKYVYMANQISELFIEDAKIIHEQTAALRLVAFIDRLYDAQIPIRNTGVSLDQIFDEEMLAGGYRKKYLRAISRMIALTHA